MGHRSIQRRRVQLAGRDGKERCYFCGDRFSDARNGSATVDHLVPESRGGTHELANLVLACAVCNRRKRAMSADEFETTAYLEARRRQVFGGELRRFRSTHPALTFASQGWSCSLCGLTGSHADSPSLRPCLVPLAVD